MLGNWQRPFTGVKQPHHNALLANKDRASSWLLKVAYVRKKPYGTPCKKVSPRESLHGDKIILVSPVGRRHFLVSALETTTMVCPHLSVSRQTQCLWLKLDLFYIS